MRDRLPHSIPTLKINEDSANHVVNLQLVFADQEDAANALTYSIVGVSNPLLFDSLTISPTDQLVLDFAADQNGSTTITIRATDTGGEFVDTIFMVSVLPVDDDPFVSNPLNTLVANEDDPSTLVDLANVFDDVDIATNGDSLKYSVISNSNPSLVDVQIKAGYLNLDYLSDQFGGVFNRDCRHRFTGQFSNGNDYLDRESGSRSRRWYLVIVSRH